jgi:hypothetical protein
VFFRNRIMQEDKMKQVVLTLCVFFTFSTTYAGELYNCIDRNGNAVITDIPQAGMKNCVLKDSSTKPSPEESTNEKANVNKDNSPVKTEDTSKARVTRINNCINCCNNKIQACYNYTADSRLCIAENENCAATCKSEGSSPSSWSDCWFQSGK